MMSTGDIFENFVQSNRTRHQLEKWIKELSYWDSQVPPGFEYVNIT